MLKNKHLKKEVAKRPYLISILYSLLVKYGPKVNFISLFHYSLLKIPTM